jgi:hypothetical protein
MWIRQSRHLILPLILWGTLLCLITSGSPAAAQTPELWITSDLNDDVLHYDGLTGDYLGLVRDGSHIGGAGPSSLTIGPDGRPYLSLAYADMVVRYIPDLKTFELFTSGGSLNLPHQIAFGPDGDL